MYVSCECYALSGRGLCDGPIPRSEKFYRLWCVIVCDLETSRMRCPSPRRVVGRDEKKNVGVEGHCCMSSLTMTHSHSIGLLWTSDRSVAKASTCNNTQNT
jgi:hypothetical protein